MDSTVAPGTEAGGSETDPGGGLQLAMDRAAQIAAAAGEKWTPTRARVYELLLVAGKPTKAYDLIPAFAADRNTKPPTIYRALDFLEGLGLVHHIPSMSLYTARRMDGAAYAASFLICKGCGSTQEVTPNLSKLVERVSDQHRFQFGAATLEIHGLCRTCNRPG
jgi:Fur family zinc uptake transcriptional regulator